MSYHESVHPAENAPFFTPRQPIPAGTAFEEQPEGKKVPLLFQPLKLKGGLTLQNRIGVSPMCSYSANEKFEATPWHHVHYGAFVNSGPGLTIVEATSVSPEGGLSPNDLGIWNDEQARALKPIVDYAHSQRQHIGIQLAHGGRKASTEPPYVHLERSIPESQRGWPSKIVAPSAIEFRKGGSLPVPNELTNEGIKRIVKEWGAAAKRAVEVSGFDAVEVHAAHGYLIHEFYSSISNKRTDEYGGSFENRIRFLLEVIDEVKANIPKDFPLLLRISASDNSDDEEGAWTIEDSVKLAPIVVARGIQVITTSSGGNSSAQRARGILELSHAAFAKEVKKAVGDTAYVACVGGLTSAETANKFIEEGAFDIALAGRAFLKNPSLLIQWAEELGVKIYNARQVEWTLHLDRDQIIASIVEASKRAAELKL